MNWLLRWFPRCLPAGTSLPPRPGGAALILWLALLAGCATFGARVVHERPSMFGSISVTEEADGLLALRFGRDGITQSMVRPGDPGYLHFTYARLAVTGLALVPQARRVLVVGLGAGSLPMFVRRHFPDMRVDVVEIDPQVAAVAREYFGFREDSRLALHIGDGRRFIEESDAGSYDVILLDAFGAAEVPPHLATLEFLVATRRALTPDGVVVSNLWNARYNRMYDAMLATHRQAFAGVHVIDTRREVNHVALAMARQRHVTGEILADMARRMAAERGFAFDPGPLVASGYLAGGTGTGAPVLRDADMRRQR